MKDINVINMVLQKNRYLSFKALLNEIGPYIHAVIKGEPLSLLSYGKTGYRMSADIDILVHKDNIYNIEQILKKQGYTTRNRPRRDRVIINTYSHQVSSWEKTLGSLGKIVIDLNYDIFWGEYKGKRIDIDEFLSDTIEMDIYGVKVKTLPPIKAMVQLILHHYKDMNSIYLLATRKSIKYNMYKDLYYLWKNNQDDISLDKLYSISLKYEIIPYVFYIFYYTNQIFKDAELQKYVNAFRTPEGETLLNCYGLCDKERKEWKYDFQTRLGADNLYDLIKDDLTEKDKEKIKINKRVFMGVTK